MHDTSMVTMKKFVEQYQLTERNVVVDIGSYDYNGSYRSLFLGSDGHYIGADIVEGPGVDVIVGSSKWDDLKDVDAVISGQTFEHVSDIPLLLGQIKKILKSGGLLCVIAPSAGPVHNCPIWVGYFSVEKMSEIITAAGFEIIDCTVNDVEPFRDTCCVARKPEIKIERFVNESYI